MNYRRGSWLTVMPNYEALAVGNTKAEDLNVDIKNVTFLLSRGWPKWKKSTKIKGAWEIPGGKPKEEDKGLMVNTAHREAVEEARYEIEHDAKEYKNNDYLMAYTSSAHAIQGDPEVHYGDPIYVFIHNVSCGLNWEEIKADFTDGRFSNAFTIEEIQGFTKVEGRDEMFHFISAFLLRNPFCSRGGE